MRQITFVCGGRQRVEIARAADLDAIPLGRGGGEVVLAVRVQQGLRIGALAQQRIVESDVGLRGAASTQAGANVQASGATEYSCVFPAAIQH